MHDLLTVSALRIFCCWCFFKPLSFIDMIRLSFIIPGTSSTIIIILQSILHSHEKHKKTQKHSAHSTKNHCVLFSHAKLWRSLSHFHFIQIGFISLENDYILIRHNRFHVQSKMNVNCFSHTHTHTGTLMLIVWQTTIC